MIIGTPREIKNHEYRVGLTPESARELAAHGHRVLVETGAGEGIGAHDRSYVEAGAEIVGTSAEIFAAAEMIVKVKELQAGERAMLRPGQILYAYLHLAPDPEQTRDLMTSGAVCIAYETVTSPHGGLPLLKPMSEVAGKMAIQVGAKSLEKANGGKGILLGGVPGVRNSKVAIIGGGVVGTCAAKVAVGMGADVTILDVSLNRLTYLDDIFGGTLKTLMSDSENIARCVREADLVVGAVLIPGAKAPKLVTKELIKEMSKGSVVVDVAVDQGGCIETIHATTHDNPTYEVSGVIHYGVANMPGAVPMTSTFALTNATRPYGRKIADMGLKAAVESDIALARGLNTFGGHVTYEAVARDLGYDYVPLADAMAGTVKKAKK